MGLISRYVAGPYQGVSQAPPQARLEGQCEAMENCLPAIPNGLQKRPPFTLNSAAWLLDYGASSGMLMADVPRGSLAEDLTLLINNYGGHNQVHVRRGPSLTAVPVNISAEAQAYLDANTTAPGTDMFVSTIEDTTFIVNKARKVEQGEAIEPLRPPEAVIFIKAGNYGRTYTVIVSPEGGTQVSAIYQTPDGSVSTEAFGTGTENIALALETGTPGPGGAFTGAALNTLASQGFTVGRIGSVIYLRRDTGGDFTLSVVDDQGGTAAAAIKGSVQRFSDLPAQAVDGLVVKVAQGAAGPLDDYWVQFQVSGSDTTGVWQEVRAPGTNMGLDPETMPVTLQYDPETEEATVAIGPWTGRTTGDATGSPDPAFVGDYIQRVEWFRGRLGIIHNGGIVYSSSVTPYRTSPSTLVTALDSDPISLLNPASEKAFFKDGRVLAKQHILLADKVQAAVSTDGRLIPGATRIDQVGSEEYTPHVPALASSRRLYYAALRTTSAIIYEMALDRVSGELKSDDMTPAVPTYLPPTLNRAAIQQSDYMRVYGTSGSATLYLHLCRYADEERVQNAWSRWTLPPGFVLGGMFFKGSVLHLAALRGDRAWMFTLDVTPLATDPGTVSNLLTHLDARVAVTGVYSAEDDTTTWTYPFAALAGVPIRVTARAGNANAPEGAILAHKPYAVPGELTVDGDSSGPAYLGYVYTSLMDPSRFFKVGQDGRPEFAGRLSLRRLVVDMAKSSFLQATVTIKGRTPRTHAWEGYLAGDPETPMDKAAQALTSKWTFAAAGPNDQLSIRFSNDSHLGFRMLGFEWWADWTPKARRVS